MEPRLLLVILAMVMSILAMSAGQLDQQLVSNCQNSSKTICISIKSREIVYFNQSKECFPTEADTSPCIGMIIGQVKADQTIGWSLYQTIKYNSWILCISVVSEYNRNRWLERVPGCHQLLSQGSLQDEERIHDPEAIALRQVLYTG